MDVDKAIATQQSNIATSTGVTLETWIARIDERRAGGARHGQLVAWLKSEYGLSHGNANTLVHTAAERARPDVDPVAEQYAGGKVGLRPIYEALVAAATFLGDDVEVAPRKTCVSLRRGKQFAMLTPATRTRLDLGLNLKGIDPGGRLRAASGMCTHTIALTSIEDVDDEVRGWLWEAYERA